MDKLLKGQNVEWHTIEQIFHLRNGYTPSKSNEAYWTNGTIPWFRMEDIRENGNILDSALQQISESAVKGNKLFPKNSFIIATSATIGEHALITVPYLANQRFTNLSLKDDFINRFNIYFLYYYLFKLDEWCRNNTTMSSFASVDMNGFRKFEIPIPPLNVQDEIVRILDAFTAITAELTQELAKEKILREKQYQYYRDKLLSFSDSEIRWKKLGEVVKIKNGKDWKNLGQGDIPVYGSGGIMNYVDKASYDKVSVLIPRKGTITNIFYTEKPFWNVDTIFYTEIDESQIFPKFLFHFMKNFDLTTLSTDSTRPSLTQTTLNKISIPLPSLNEQKRISNILDKFEALTHSITEGLPKEIALREQQYEYYREQLIDFPKN
ncbi:restriction endonuclease subunit S (plasmid) [Moraxella osloensis]|uniref:Restriction endonuclease subunit S n=1 Tax=Faucicola osloensis TaxID=34062 RepID=A0A2D2LY65_FAUOS|nr:restriction endonuclease subunit S [Moraxella osloensis]